MTIDELRKIEERYQQAARRAEQLREERNAAVAAALEERMTHAEIARATGLSRGRIGQLAKEKT